MRGGGNTVNVFGSATGSLLKIHGQDGQDSVDIGVGNALTYHGDVSVDNPAGSTNLIIDDSKVASPQTIAFDWMGFASLTPATIAYGTGVTELTLAGGTGGNQWTLGSPTGSVASQITTTIDTGVAAAGANNINVLSTPWTLDIDDQASDSITIGNSGTVGDPGTLSYIGGQINLGVATGKTVEITLDNSSAMNTETYDATLSGGPAASTLSGLLPHALEFPPDKTTSLTLLAGPGQGDNALNVDFTSGNPLPPNLDFDAEAALGTTNALNIFGGGTASRPKPTPRPVLDQVRSR